MAGTIDDPVNLAFNFSSALKSFGDAAFNFPSEPEIPLAVLAREARNTHPTLTKVADRGLDMDYKKVYFTYKTRIFWVSRVGEGWV